MFYRVEIVLQAFILTLSTFVCLTSYTFQSKRDYSSWGAGLFAALWVLIGAGFLGVSFTNSVSIKACTGKIQWSDAVVQINFIKLKNKIKLLER